MSVWKCRCFLCNGLLFQRICCVSYHSNEPRNIRCRTNLAKNSNSGDAINVPGLKKRKGFFFRICNLIRKSTNPFLLTENAKGGNKPHFLGEYSLADSSFIFVVEVYENSKALLRILESLFFICEFCTIPYRSKSISHALTTLLTHPLSPL